MRKPMPTAQEDEVGKGRRQEREHKQEGKTNARKEAVGMERYNSLCRAKMTDKLSSRG